MEIGKGPAQTIESVTTYVQEQRKRSDAYLFGLFIDDTLRGTCRLHNITETGADIGIALFDKTIWGQGWGSRLITEITIIATTSLGCPRIKAGIEPTNLSSIHAFKKADFVFVKESEEISGNASWEA